MYIKFGQHSIKDVDSRVFTRMLRKAARKKGRNDGRTVALLYPFATSLARGRKTCIDLLPSLFDVFGCNTGYPVFIIVILL